MVKLYLYREDEITNDFPDFDEQHFFAKVYIEGFSLGESYRIRFGDEYVDFTVFAYDPCEVKAGIVRID